MLALVTEKQKQRSVLEHSSRENAKVIQDLHPKASRAGNGPATLFRATARPLLLICQPQPPVLTFRAFLAFLGPLNVNTKAN